MNSLQIRQAKARDTRRMHTLLGQLGYKSDSVNLETYLDTDQRTDEVYVAETEGNVIGLMAVIFFDYFPSQQKICRITAIVVDESVRGCGVGTDLLKFAKTLALSRSCAQIEVTTSMIRERTQKYYESIGFNKSSYRYIQNIDN